MTFDANQFGGLVAAESETQQRLFTQYAGERGDFDIIVIGSGMGGGLLADDLADRVGHEKRILVLDAGSYLLPTHVYNVSRFDNGDVARSFACQNFWQQGGPQDERYIHERPQLNFGGRSVFWSGLIPTIQPWELNYFPSQVRTALSPQKLEEAGQRMNQSVTLGQFAQDIVAELQSGPLGQSFHIAETPRALHQPYLTRSGSARGQYFVEPTGVFNTAELLLNQLGRDRDHDGAGLHLALNQYVEDVKQETGGFELISRTTLNGHARHFHAKRVVLAAGSVESPKLLARSTLGRTLSASVRGLVGKGLTDHPTTDGLSAQVTHCGNIPIPKNAHAKIILYSKGALDQSNELRYPFNIEVNINHEYWHRRDNDPNGTDGAVAAGASRVDLKFSFGNCLDDGNAVQDAAPYQYVPEISFRNLNWTSHLTERFQALAGWHKSGAEVFDILNRVASEVFGQFGFGGSDTVPDAFLGQQGKGFGRGTVHHAVGTLRMPRRPAFGTTEDSDSVVDQELQLKGAAGFSVCDMSVMPFSSAANPVRTLAALALRLSKHLEP